MSHVVRRRILVSVSASMLLFAATHPSVASPPDPAPQPPSLAETLNEARRETLYKEARELIKGGQPDDGLKVLEKALEIRESPDVLFWKGYAQEQRGDLVEAKRIYLQVLDEARAQQLDPVVTGVNKALDRIGPRLSRLTAHLPSGVKATGEIDGRAWPDPVDEGIDVSPGAHVVIFKAAGRQTYRHEHLLNAGEETILEVALPRLPESPPPPPPPSRPARSMGALALDVTGGWLSAEGTLCVGIGGYERDKRTIALGAGMLAAGGALLAGGIVWGIRSSKPPSPRAVVHRASSEKPMILGVGLSPTPGGVSIGAGGQF